MKRIISYLLVSTLMFYSVCFCTLTQEKASEKKDEYITHENLSKKQQAYYYRIIIMHILLLETEMETLIK